MKNLTRIVTTLAMGSLLIAASPNDHMINRDIKALSPDRAEKLKTGSGAGYALPAELNGYPGPRHVLDLADALKLTKDQFRETSQLFHQMKAEAIPLGRRIIEQERELDILFRRGQANEESLFRLTAAIGESESQLRATHLKYHLRMVPFLTAEQRAIYGRLRGYHGGH